MWCCESVSLLSAYSPDNHITAVGATASLQSLRFGAATRKRTNGDSFHLNLHWLHRLCRRCRHDNQTAAGQIGFALHDLAD
jgi:hypothetical protein